MRKIGDGVTNRMLKTTIAGAIAFVSDAKMFGGIYSCRKSTAARPWI